DLNLTRTGRNLTVTLESGQGTPLASQLIRLLRNESLLAELTTGSSGEARYRGLPYGAYLLHAIYDGNTTRNISGDSARLRVNITDGTTGTPPVQADTVLSLHVENRTLLLRLSVVDGGGLPNRTISVFRNTTRLGTVTTDAAGNASYSPLPSGTYNLSAVFEGNRSVGVDRALAWTLVNLTAQRQAQEQTQQDTGNESEFTNKSRETERPEIRELDDGEGLGRFRVRNPTGREERLTVTPHFRVSVPSRYVVTGEDGSEIDVDREDTDGDGSTDRIAFTAAAGTQKNVSIEERREDIDVTVENYAGVPVGINPRIRKTSDGYTVELPKKRAIEPGRYRLVVNTKQGKKHLWFTWGLISI
ncbi:MAG: Ig-like domain-containing protein, partial [Candidatus Nanohaloarchaea archaeon]|nr:Ig-like domain-containing protein [Candidatus Nanohaloarchaea archaeon]